MEDPAKRRERLQAMRSEFSQTGASAETSVNPSHLSNPLAETSGTFPSQETSYETQRFDFYTDPMSGFSSKKRNKTDRQTELCSPVSQFPPSIPGPMGNTHGSFEAGHYDSGNPHFGPRGAAHPSPPYHGTPPQESWNRFRSPSLNFRPFQSPCPVTGPFPSYQGSPDPGHGFGARGNFGQPLNPDYAPPFSNYGWQNARSGGRRTGPGPGRGRGGGGRNMNTSFGRNGGRQQEYDRTAFQAAPGPERFYNNSMAEDPWKYLEPVLWKSCSDASSGFSTRQACAPDKLSSSQQTLAEYLASSLDESTCCEPNN